MKNKSKLKELLKYYFVDSSSVLGRVIDAVILIINLLFCLLFVLDTYSFSDATKKLFFSIELFLVAFFIIEYIIRFYVAENKLKYLFNIYSLIDIISIIPTFSFLILPFFGLSINIWIVKFVRIFKVLRVFRFIRFTSSTDFFFGRITYHLLKVVRLVLTIAIIFFISSGLFFYIESSVNPRVQNFGDAFYFSVIALSTVGFGDITPMTNLGKWATLFMILSGIVLIPWQAGLIIKEWMLISSKVSIICKKCGLKYHDSDASHCKHCGNIIYQETDGES